MIVHLSNGETIVSTDVSQWEKEDQKAIARVVLNLSTSADIRFSAGIDGEAVFVLVRTEMVTYLELSEDEYSIFNLALDPPQEEKPNE